MIRFMVGPLGLLALALGSTTFAQETTTYVRHKYGGNVSYGVLEDETIHELRGDVFTDGQLVSAPATRDARRGQAVDADGTA